MQRLQYLDGKYLIVGRARWQKDEVIDSFDTREEANRMLHEYRMAFGCDWSLWMAVYP